MAELSHTTQPLALLLRVGSLQKNGTFLYSTLSLSKLVATSEGVGIKPLLCAYLDAKMKQLSREGIGSKKEQVEKISAKDCERRVF